MSFIISLLIGKWAKMFWPALILVAALTSVYLYWNGRNETIHEQAQKIDDLREELVIRKNEYESNEKVYLDAIADQNEKIDSLYQQTIKNEADAQYEVDKVNTANNVLTSKLQDMVKLINDMETPKNCQESIDLVVDIAIQNKWPTEKK